MKKCLMLIPMILVLIFPAISHAQNASFDRDTFCISLASFIGGAMNEIGASQDDMLAAAIAKGGASRLEIPANYVPGSNQDVKATFYILGMNPKSTAMPAYQQDPFAFWQALAEAINAYSCKVSLKVTVHDGSFSLDGKQFQALASAIGKAAAKARECIRDKSLLAPLTDLIVPAPVKAKGRITAIEEENYTALFLRFAGLCSADFNRRALACAAMLLKNGSVALDDSGAALIVTCQSPANLGEFMDQALTDAMEDMKRDSQAKNYSDEELQNHLLDKLEPLVLAFLSDKKAQSREYGFTLPLNSEYGEDTWYQPSADYLNEFSNCLEQTMEKMKEQISLLPGYPAMEEPKTGRLSGSSSGTHITLKIPDDGLSRYIVFCSGENQKELAGFIRKGSSLKVRLPQGEYYLLIGAGDTWYGTGYLFGENGFYSKTDSFQVPSSDYRYEITLTPITNLSDGIPIYNADLSDFPGGE